MRQAQFSQIGAGRTRPSVSDIEPAVLRPFDPAEAITTAAAARRANVAASTVRNWCAQYSIGRKFGHRGQYRVSKVALQMLLEGDEAALGAYLAGDRSSPAVVHYYTRTGVPLLLVRGGAA